METFRIAAAPAVLSLVMVPLIGGTVYFSDAFQDTGLAAAVSQNQCLTVPL